MLNETVCTLISLADFAFRSILTKKPVISQRFLVLLFSLPDALSRLSLEFVQLPPANGHPGAHFYFAHCYLPMCFNPIYLNQKLAAYITVETPVYSYGPSAGVLCRAHVN
jgi:hypothetical protein